MGSCMLICVNQRLRGRKGCSPSFSPFSVSHTHTHTHTHTHSMVLYTHTHTHIVWYYTHTQFNKKMQSNHSTNYSVLCLMHMVEQLIIPHSLILSKVGFQLFVSFSLLSQLSSVCPTVLGSVSAVCPSLQWLAVPLSVSCLSHHVISLSHHPHQLSVLLPTQLSTRQLSVLPSLSVISMSLLPPLSVISLSLLTPLSVISLSLLTPLSVISPPQLSNPWSALAVYTTVNVTYLTCLSHYFSCGSHCLNCHLSFMLSIQLSKMPTVNQTVWKKTISIPLSKCQLSISLSKCQLFPLCLKCQLSIPLSISGSSRSSGSWKTKTNLKSGKWLISRWVGGFVTWLMNSFSMADNLFFLSSHNLFLMSSQPWRLYQGQSKGWC